jgi:glycine/D-amino acid oxidase-like deaminating enzyme
VIVGAGIVGASIAFHLARRGTPVTVVDAGDPAGGATARSFAWINSWSAASEDYARLRHHSMQAYHSLQQTLHGALPLTWSGALIWKADVVDTRHRARDQAAAGYDVRLVGPEDIASLEPGLRSAPAVAAFTAAEGAIEPVEATRVLLAAARDAGAEIRLPATVDSLVVNSGRATGVRISDETLAADRVVLAAGTGTGTLAASAGIVLPMQHSPALLIRFRTRGRLISRVIINPDFEIRQVSDTVLLAATNYQEASGEYGPDAIAKRLQSTLKARFSGCGDLQLDGVKIGFRPIPADGLPVIGFAPQVDGLYLSVMHSGITLAPAAGRFAAAELLDDTEIRLLDICRPHRL